MILNLPMTFPALTELQPQGKKAIAMLRELKYRISPLNIIYFEGLDADDLATPNNDRVDYWNDVRAVITDAGDVLMSALATTEPGWYYRLNRMNPKGAAQLCFGQWLDCWEIGRHYKQDALVQCGKLAVRRDNNEDGYRTNDRLDSGLFGINQHTTANAPDLVGKWSAGCLVGKHPATHARFMAMCRSMGRQTFDTTLLNGGEFARFK